VGRRTRTTKPPRQVYTKLGGDTCSFQRVCLLHRGKKWKTDLQDIIDSHCKCWNDESDCLSQSGIGSDRMKH
jgi:hypothetical protein